MQPSISIECPQFSHHFSLAITKNVPIIVSRSFPFKIFWTTSIHDSYENENGNGNDASYFWSWGKPRHHHAVLRRPPPPSCPFYRPALPPLPRPSPATQRTCPCACNSTTTTTKTIRLLPTGCPSSCPSRSWTPPTRRERRPKSPRIPPTRLALVCITPFLLLLLRLCISACALLLLLTNN